MLKSSLASPLTSVHDSQVKIWRLQICYSRKAQSFGQKPLLLSTRVTDRNGSLQCVWGKKSYQSIGKGQPTGDLWVPTDIHFVGPANLSGLISPSPHPRLFLPNTRLFNGLDPICSSPKLLGCFVCFTIWY